MTAPVLQSEGGALPGALTEGGTAVIQSRSAVSRRAPRKGAKAAEVGGGLLSSLERLLGFTLAGLICAASAIALVVFGRLLPSRAMTLLGYGLILIMVISWVLGRKQLGLAAERLDLPSRVSAKRTVEVGLTLTAVRRVSTIVVEETLDRQLGASVRIGVPLLAVGSPASHSYSFTPQTRGVYEVGPTVAEFSDPFGLTRRRQVIAKPQKLIVHPRVEQALDRIVSRAFEDPPLRPPVSRRSPSGFEFYGMREYQQGDDPRRIVWRALAQYGKYLIRESEQGITDRVKIYLDNDLAGHTKDRPSGTFESAVTVAASISSGHLNDGFTVSIDLNDAPVARKPWRGSGDRIEMLDRLAGVGLGRDPLSTALDRLVTSPDRNAHNVLITPRLTQESAARLRLHLERGGHLLLVLLVHDDTDPLTVHRAGALSCAVVEVRPGVALGALFANLVTGRRG